MADVGGVDCEFVKEVFYRKAMEQSESWTVPGLDGEGHQTIGVKASGFQYRLVKLGSNATIETWYDAIVALAQTAVTIVNDHGDTRLLMFIKSIQQYTKTKDLVNDYIGRMVISGQIL